MDRLVHTDHCPVLMSPATGASRPHGSESSGLGHVGLRSLEGLEPCGHSCTRSCCSGPGIPPVRAAVFSLWGISFLPSCELPSEGPSKA